MKSKGSWASLVLLGVLTTGFLGCVEGLRASGSGVTTLQNFISGNLTPMTTFSPSDVIRFYVNITWDDVTQEPGDRVIVWNWYKEGKLVGHRENDHAYLRGAPNTRFATQPATALGTGHFTVDCLVDGRQIATAAFEIR